MTTKTEPTPINPEALRYAREQMRISQRELGRRVAARLSRGEGQRAIQVRLSRIERGDEVALEDRELLDALAAELAVGVDDLAQAPLWVWIRVRDGRPWIVELAMRMITYTSPELAYQARDWLAHATEGQFKPFADAQLVPMRIGTLTRDILDANYPGLTDKERRLLVATDPDTEGVLPYLAALNDVISEDELSKWKMDAVVQSLDLFGLIDEISQLHELALRRLRQAPEGMPELAASWQRREERLFLILEVHHRLRASRRDEALGNVPAEG